MIIIPAIDLKGGKCVRLLQGDPDRETVYSDSPAEVAAEFQSKGAGLIHVVDLDGAFEGRPVNIDLIKSIAERITIPIEVGGGIRTVSTAGAYLSAGVERIIVGSAIFEDSFEDMLKEFSGRIVAGVDVRDGFVATKGWKNVTSVKDEDLIEKLMEMGVKDIIYTDISTDGMLGGPNIEAYERLLKRFPEIRLIASGGVSSIDDIRRLNSVKYGSLAGVITGKAVYDGRLDIGEAVKLVS